jgi:hypothetical protein
VGTGATLIGAAGNIELETLSNNFAKARANRYEGGAVDVGVLVSEAVSSGTTIACLNGNGPDGDDVITAGNDLIITANASNTADSMTVAYGGAIVGVNVTVPTAVVDPTIGAYIGSNADVYVGGTVELTSISDADALLTVNGAGGAAVKVDVAVAKALVSPDIGTYIADDSTVVAGQDITLISRHNYDSDGNKLINSATDFEKGAFTKITEAGGGLVDVGVLESTAESNADVQSWVGLGSTLTAIQGNIKVEALSNNFAKAQANRLSIVGVGVGILTSEAKSKGTTIAALKGNEQGDEGTISAGSELAINAKSFITVDSDANGRDYGAAAFGSVIANATMESQTQAFTGRNTEITSANTIRIHSEADHVANAVSVGGKGGVIGDGSAEATAKLINPLTKARVGDGTVVNAPDARLEVTALNRANLSADTKQTVTAGIANNDSKATTQILNSQTLAEVGTGVYINVREFVISAKDVSVYAEALSTATVPFDLAGTNTAHATVGVILNPDVHIYGGDTIIAASDRVEILAGADSVRTNTYAYTKTTGITGNLHSIADNDKTVDVDIIVDSGTQINTTDLVVDAYAPHSEVDRYNRQAEAHPQTAVYYTLQVVDYVSRQVCNVIANIICLFGLFCKPKEVCNTILDPVYDWVASDVLGAEVTVDKLGSEKISNDIDFNADVTIAGGSNPQLVIGVLLVVLWMAQSAEKLFGYF